MAVNGVLDGPGVGHMLVKKHVNRKLDVACKTVPHHVRHMRLLNSLQGNRAMHVVVSGISSAVNARRVKAGLPGLITEQGSLSKEVGLEKVVDLAGPLGGGLVHHRLPLLDDVKQVTRISLCPACTHSRL